MTAQITPPFKRGDTFALSGVYRINGVASQLSAQTIRSQLRTSAVPRRRVPDHHQWLIAQS